MDTTTFAYVAEDRIAYELQRGGIFVAKPRFDFGGADLLGMLKVGDDAKFCRIQCKGRSVRSGRSQIVIPSEYVTPGFVLFLYVEAEDEANHLYCFFESEIRAWCPRKVKGRPYRLSIPRKSYQRKLRENVFTRPVIDKIRSAIQRSDPKTEWTVLIKGTSSICFRTSATLRNASGANSRDQRRTPTSD